MLVTSGNMPGIHDKAFTLGRKSGNYHCCASAQVTCADNGTFEIAHAPHRRLPPLNGDISTEAAKLLCVAEARRRSGTMNTVAAALAAGRDVFSVPGSIFSPLCEGTNQLLREGAVPAVSGADILLWYGLARPEQPEKAKPDGAPLSLDAQRMRDALSAAAPLPLDALCAKTGLPPPKAMAALTELELAGFSRQLAGRQFQLK